MLAAVEARWEDSVSEVCDVGERQGLGADGAGDGGCGEGGGEAPALDGCAVVDGDEGGGCEVGGVGYGESAGG